MMMIEENLDIELISQQLGHKHLDSTQIYARTSMEKKRRELERIAIASGIDINIPDINVSEDEAFLEKYHIT
jgi:predicted site-specific integrase-resolvase